MYFAWQLRGGGWLPELQVTAATGRIVRKQGKWTRAVRVRTPSECDAHLGRADLARCTVVPSSQHLLRRRVLATHSVAPRSFFVSESDGVWQPVEASLPSTAEDRSQSAAIQAISCSGVNRCTAGGYFISTFDRRDTTALTFSRTGNSWGRGELAGLPSGAAKISDQESAVSGVSCISPATCLAVGNYLDAYSQGSFEVTPATPPPAPRVMSVTAEVRGFRIVLRPPRSNGGLAIANYQYSVTSGATWLSRLPPSGKALIVITNLLPNHRYGIAVRAVSGAGIGPRFALSYQPRLDHSDQGVLSSCMAL